MKKLTLVLLSAFVLACGVKLPPVTTPGPTNQPPAAADPAARAIAVTTVDGSSSLALAGVTASLANRDTGRVYVCNASPCVTNGDGFAVWNSVPINTHVVLEFTKDGYLAGRYEVTMTETLPNFVAPLTPIVPPPPPPPNRRTQDELLHFLGNFCNLTDSKGRVVFTPFKISLPGTDRTEWYDLERKAGSTHTVLSPTIGYTGSPIPGRDLYGDPQAFRAFVLEALGTPAADGKGFTPVLMLDGGEDGRDRADGLTPRQRIDKFWPGIRAALDDVNDDIYVTPGWELVRASSWTSADYSYALNKLQELGFKHIWSHLSPGRAAWTSNPVEADDPLQGKERESWYQAGGQFVEGLLYQSDAVRGNDDKCDPADDGCWLNRLEDVVPRLGNGMNQWRVMHLVYFEGPAYYYYRGQTDGAFAIRIADAAKRMCEKYSVVCGYGNGIPSSVFNPSRIPSFNLAHVAPPTSYSFTLTAQR